MSASNLPAYSLPMGDVIQRRIDNKYAQKRIEKHHETRRVPMASYPVMPWLLNQEALVAAVRSGQRRVVSQQEALEYGQVKISQPCKPRLNLELPHNSIGDLIWKVVSFIGRFFDAWHAAHA